MSHTNGYVNRAAPVMLGAIEALAGAAPVEWAFRRCFGVKRTFAFFVSRLIVSSFPSYALPKMITNFI